VQKGGQASSLLFFGASTDHEQRWGAPLADWAVAAYLGRTQVPRR
jgi:hypothetical protein